MSMTQESVYLVGFMLSGKTTAGRLLAERLGRGFADLDLRIEQRCGRPVAEIWADKGEEAFRDLESAELERLAGSRLVIATGGGVLLRVPNRERIARTGLAIWLRTPFAILWERAKEGPRGVRPLLGSKTALRRLLAEREHLYASAGARLDVAGGEDPERTAAALAAIVRAWEEGR